MTDLLQVILPVFFIVGFGYVAVWHGLFTTNGVDAVMKFAQNFAIPFLLFKAIATMDLTQNFDVALLGSFYLGATICFGVGLFGARVIFNRPWEDCVAIGFCALFSNSVLMGLPITERAFGPDALGPNFAIIALHAPYCYVLGFIVMELVRARGAGLGAAAGAIGRAIGTNPLMIGIAMGALANVTSVPIPGVAWDAIDMMARAALPVALFGLGGVLCQYRPEGDIGTIAFICGLSLILHPFIVWTLGTQWNLTTEQFRSAVLTSAMSPGINTYIFANMYGVAKRVAASSVLIGTALSVFSISIWLGLLT